MNVNYYKKYPSKVSYGLLAIIFLIFFAPLIPSFFNTEFNEKMIGTIGFLSLVFAFVLHLFLKTEYTIDKNKLKIKCGFFTYKPIEIKDIKEVSKTSNIISSPAPSFDRIEIKYGKFDTLIISPKDKSSFVKDLTKINPDIKSNI